MRRGLVLIIVLFIAAARGRAQLEDPPTLHFGPGANTGLTCATGNIGQDVAMGCANGPNAISDTRLDIFQQQGSAPWLVTPLVLILGVPNDSSGSAFGSGNIVDRVLLYPDYFSAPGTLPGDVTFRYGMAGNPFGFPAVDGGGNARGFQGVLAEGDLYSALNVGGRNGVDNSVNMTNLIAAESRLGITATGFGLYIFSLNVNSTDRQFVAHSLLDVWFKSPLPLGTFGAAYGQAANGTPYVTAWTNAGVAVPEPSTMLLVIAASLVGGALARRRIRHRP